MLFFSHTHMQGSKRGFTLLLAALVATIVLALGSSLFTIARKQVNLSSLGRDSQFAFYAADTIAECSLYFDIRFQAFPTSTASQMPSAVTCDGVTVVPTVVSATANSAQVQFEINLFTQNESGQPQAGNCAQATITKTDTSTLVHADGYSTSCATITSSARALQRSIEIRY